MMGSVKKIDTISFTLRCSCPSLTPILAIAMRYVFLSTMYFICLLFFFQLLITCLPCVYLMHFVRQSEKHYNNNDNDGNSYISINFARDQFTWHEWAGRIAGQISERSDWANEQVRAESDLVKRNRIQLEYKKKSYGTKRKIEHEKKNKNKKLRKKQHRKRESKWNTLKSVPCGWRYNAQRVTCISSHITD